MKAFKSTFFLSSFLIINWFIIITIASYYLRFCITCKIENKKLSLTWLIKNRPSIKWREYDGKKKMMMKKWNVSNYILSFLLFHLPSFILFFLPLLMRQNLIVYFQSVPQRRSILLHQLPFLLTSSNMSSSSSHHPHTSHHPPSIQ